MQGRNLINILLSFEFNEIVNEPAACKAAAFFSLLKDNLIELRGSSDRYLVPVLRPGSAGLLHDLFLPGRKFQDRGEQKSGVPKVVLGRGRWSPAILCGKAPGG